MKKTSRRPRGAEVVERVLGESLTSYSQLSPDLLSRIILGILSRLPWLLPSVDTRPLLDHLKKTRKEPRIAGPEHVGAMLTRYLFGEQKHGHYVRVVYCSDNMHLWLVTTEPKQFKVEELDKKRLRAHLKQHPEDGPRIIAELIRVVGMDHKKTQERQMQMLQRLYWLIDVASRLGVRYLNYYAT